MTSNLNLEKHIKIRESNVEFLKIIAVFMIVVCHSTPDYVANPSSFAYVNVNLSYADFSRFLICCLKYLGQIGDCIFIVCSSYYLCGPNSQVRVKKLLLIILDCFFIEIFWNIALSWGGYSVAFDVIFFPVIKGNNWFVLCYILMYLFHPIFNAAIEYLSRKQLSLMVGSGILMYGMLAILIDNNIFYYNSFIGFALVYFVTGYCKKYKNKFFIRNGKKIFLGSCCILILLLCTTNYLGLLYTEVSTQMQKWNRFQSILIMAMSIGLFYIFLKWKYRNILVNKVASTALFVYLFDENISFRKYVKPQIWEWIYNCTEYSHLILYVFFMSTISFIVSVILGIAYNSTIRFGLEKIFEKFSGICSKNI